jgi:hypothetical protein
MYHLHFLLGTSDSGTLNLITQNETRSTYLLLYLPEPIGPSAMKATNAKGGSPMSIPVANHQCKPVTQLEPYYCTNLIRVSHNGRLEARER